MFCCLLFLYFVSKSQSLFFFFGGKGKIKQLCLCLSNPQIPFYILDERPFLILLNYGWRLLYTCVCCRLVNGYGGFLVRISAAFVKGAWYSQVPCFSILWVIVTLSNQPRGTFQFCDGIPQMLSDPSPRQSGKNKVFHTCPLLTFHWSLG